MKPKPVEQIAVFDGKIVALYYSIGEAAKAAGTGYNKMLELIRTGQPYNRYRYKHYGEPIGHIEQLLPIQQYDKTTGEIVANFKTIVAAAEELNYGRNIISRHIKNGTQDKWGYYWRKFDGRL